MKLFPRTFWGIGIRTISQGSISEVALSVGPWKIPLRTALV